MGIKECFDPLKKEYYILKYLSEVNNMSWHDIIQRQLSMSYITQTLNKRKNMHVLLFHKLLENSQDQSGSANSYGFSQSKCFGVQMSF